MLSRRSMSAAGFVGRTAEWEALLAQIDALADGSGGIVFLTGEPGIGKTRLAREAATEARRRDADVLWGTSYEGDWSPPFGPWVEALRALADGIDPLWLHGRLGPGGPLLVNLVPELRVALPEDAPAPEFGEQSRFQLNDAVGRLLAEVAARRPIVVVIDDLHWADGDSLGLFRAVARLTARLPILLIGAYREADLTAQHPLVPLLADLRRNHEPSVFGLRAFSPAEVSDYLARCVEPAAAGPLTGAIYAETSGNPFFVCEMTRHVLDGGLLPEGSDRPATVTTIPDGVRRVLAHRLAGMSEATVAALRAACVFSGAIEFDVLAALTGQDEDTLLDSIDQAIRSGILRTAAGGREQYEFTHAIVRHTLYDEMTAGRRIRLHRRAAEAIERIHGAGTGAHLAEMAHHYLRASPAGDVERAIVCARDAGDHAFRLHAYEEAIRLYQQALDVLTEKRQIDQVTRCEILLSLGQARMRAAKTGPGRAAFLEAASAAREAGRSDLLARAALGHATFYQPGEVEETLIELLREALEAIDADDSPTRASLMARLAQALYWSDAVEERGTLSREAIAMARRLEDPAVLARTINSGGFAVWGPDDVEERLANSNEVIRLATRLGHDELRMAGLVGRIVASLELGDIADVDSAIDEHRRAAQRSGYPPRVWLNAIFRTMRAILAGRLEEAEGMVGETFAIGRRTEDNSGPVQYFGLQMFALRLLQGRGDELEPMLAELVARFPHIPAYRSGLALVHAEAGRRDAAAPLFEVFAADGFAGIPRDMSWLITITNLAQVCACLGDVGQADVLYRMLRPYASHCIVSASAAACYGSAERSLGLLASTMARWDEAAAHFERALAMHTRMGAAPWTARTAYDFALSLLVQPSQREAGTRERARALLEPAIAMASSMGMTGLATAAGERLASIAAQGSRRRPVLPAGLTVREAEVLRLIATGRTNREIADELVLSLATIERHITNLYAKIDARGRADATTFALRHGIVEPAS